jgi:hypothetical protein
MTPEIEKQIKYALSMFADKQANINENGYKFADEIIAEKMGIMAANVFSNAIRATDGGFYLHDWYTVENLWAEMLKAKEKQDAVLSARVNFHRILEQMA